MHKIKFSIPHVNESVRNKCFMVKLKSQTSIDIAEIEKPK